MKSFELDLNESINEDCLEARVGGMALLPESITWPQNKDQEDMILLASIPIKWLKQYVNISLANDQYISIFSTYNDDYFLDYLTDPELVGDYTKVLVHAKGEPRCGNSELKILARKLNVGNLLDEEYYASKVGGVASLLQNDQNADESWIFALQFYGGDFPEPFTDVFYLSDAVGYLWLSSNQHDGKFIVQCG